MTIAGILIAMLLLLLAKGFFSGSEIAFVSADRVRLRSEASRGKTGARAALTLLSHPARLLTTTLLGTNISTVLLTTIGTILMAGLFGSAGEILAMAVFTPVFLILGEIVPKSVYQQRADAIVPAVAPSVTWIQTVFRPLVWFFARFAELIARMFGGDADLSIASRDQVLATVQMAEKTGAIEAFSRGQVRRVLRFAQMTAGEAMWPMSHVPCLDVGAGTAQLLEVRRQTGHRLVPLRSPEQGRITGVAVVETWDLMDPEVGSRCVDSFLGPVDFVPSTEPLTEIIEDLHGDPRKILIVTESDGRCSGLLTLNVLVRGTLGVHVSPLTGLSEDYEQEIG